MGIKGLRNSAVASFLLGMAILLAGGYFAKEQVPPIPERVAAGDETLTDRAAILHGQDVYQRYGLMDHGSVWGHGTLRGMDFSAYTLHCTAWLVTQYHAAGDRPTAEGFARKLAAIAPIDQRIQVLGPAEAPLAVIKGRYRFRLLVKSLRNVDLSEYLREWLAAGPKTKGNLKLEIDVDPQSFL